MEAALRVVCLYFFGDLNHCFDVLIFGHQSHDELDGVADGDEERDTNGKHEVKRLGDRLVFFHEILRDVDVCGLELVCFVLNVVES